MMMRPLNMGANDLAIEYAVMILSRREDSFDYQKIADFCGCSRRTIVRCMSRLIEDQRVIRTGSKRHGYRYTLGSEALVNVKL